MNVSIFGLGYVGAVTAGCLSERGHRVTGVDVQEAKVAAFNSGQSPIIEPGLDELLAQARKNGRLSATTDAMTAVAETDVSIVCVGTPSLDNGRLNLSYVSHVATQIASAIRAKSSPHVVIFRSTMLPGSTRKIAAESLAELEREKRVRIYYCPEFLREGTAVKDFHEPSLVVVGTTDSAAPEGREPVELLGLNPAVLSWEGAEMIKYACNYLHALKVGFANEIGRLGKHLGVDGSQVMDVVCRDTKLNISRYYMRPGNPFGGSCLPKDVSALGGFARMEGVQMPLLESTLPTNAAHQDALIRLVTAKEKRTIGVLGLAFKADTDDLRGSPMVALAETLLGRGYDLHIYDPQLNLSRLIGSNQAEINRRMPHLAKLLRSSPREVIEQSEVVVAAQKCARLDELAGSARAEQFVVDVNGWPELKQLPWHYEGICW